MYTNRKPKEVDKLNYMSDFKTSLSGNQILAKSIYTYIYIYGCNIQRLVIIIITNLMNIGKVILQPKKEANQAKYIKSASAKNHLP